MFIRLKNGATWQVLGSDRYDAAVGSPPYGVTFSEWALSNPASWAYLASWGKASSMRRLPVCGSIQRTGRGSIPASNGEGLAAPQRRPRTAVEASPAGWGPGGQVCALQQHCSHADGRPPSTLSGSSRLPSFDRKRTESRRSQIPAGVDIGRYGQLSADRPAPRFAPSLSSAASSACASAISGISGLGEKPSSAGARAAWASTGRPVD